MASSAYLKDKLLRAVLLATGFTGPATLYVALFQGDPEGAGTEVSGGSYARQTIVFGAPSAGSAANSSAPNFTSMPAASGISHIAIYDAATAGNRLTSQALAASKTTNAGDTIAIAVGAVTVSVSP